MAAGKVHHWKHGWIPADAFARSVLAKRQADSEANLKVNPSTESAHVDLGADEMKALRREREQVLGGLGSDDLKALRREREQVLEDAAASKRAAKPTGKGNGLYGPNGIIAPVSQWGRAAVGDFSTPESRRAEKDAARQQRYAAHLKDTADKRAAQSQRYLDHLNKKNGFAPSAKPAPSRTADQMAKGYHGDFMGGWYSDTPQIAVGKQVKAGKEFSYNPAATKNHVDKNGLSGTLTQAITVPQNDNGAVDYAIQALITNNPDAFKRGARIVGRKTSGGYQIGIVGG